MTTMPQSSSSSSSSPTDRKGNKQEDRPIVKMDPLLRDDFQLYLRVALLLSISVYTAIKVNSVVVDPYLDEVFHIPQAQRYCLMHFKDWDDKITTPPGLYLLSYVYVGFVQTILPIYRFVLQNIPTFSTTPTGWETKPGATSSFTHASLEHCSTVSLRFLNVIGGSIFVPWLVYEIYLYVQSPYHQVIPPPIPVVVVAGPGPGGSLADPKEVEKAKRKTELPPGVGPKEPVPKVDVIEERLNYEASAAQTAMNWSLVSLFFRQTNILWTIFLVLLSAIRILKRLHPPAPSSLLNHHPLTLSAILGRAGYGGMYDPSIIHSDVSDYFKSLLSIAISGYSNLSPVLIAIEPYIYVVSLFGFFVYWNGSIALGDKTNHVSTFHPVQLFYFSLFTLLSTPFVFLTNPINLIVTTVKSLLGSPLKAISTITAGLLIAGAVHQFTYTHPFMLADNRHYVFYIWRRTILSHRNAKYMGIPLYLFSSFFVYRQIGVKPPALPPSIKSINPQSSAVVYTTHTITFLLAFLAATAGTLVFAPLVEFSIIMIRLMITLLMLTLMLTRLINLLRSI
ncbi:glucosyltransferase [Orbilia oligospora]|nr:glucosyltransferase [Orbilia oligospora]